MPVSVSMGREATSITVLRMPGPLLVVDAPSVMYRAFFALPDSIVGGNALLGSANIVLRVIADHRPRAVVMCFGAEAAAYRTAAFAPYHADRPEMPEKLAEQWAEADAFFTAFGWTVTHHEELEADDLLGSYAWTEEEAGGTCLVLTGDRDMYQVASERTTVLYLKTGTRGVEEVTPQEVEKRYGIPPALVPDFIALRGDPSDGLPGAKGIGEKTAKDLLREHGSLEGAIAAALTKTPKVRGALIGHEDELQTFKDIATLRRVAVERPEDRETDVEGAAAAARERGLNQLGKRLDEGGVV
jgi:DNA polymerase-1